MATHTDCEVLDTSRLDLLLAQYTVTAPPPGGPLRKAAAGRHRQPGYTALDEVEALDDDKPVYIRAGCRRAAVEPDASVDEAGPEDARKVV